MNENWEEEEFSAEEAEADILCELDNDISGDWHVSQPKPSPIHPGLFIEGFGSLGLPLSRSDINQLCNQGREAKYGNGFSAGIYEICSTTNGKNVRFLNPEWQSWISGVVGEVAKSMGFQHAKYQAVFRRLLIYEPGAYCGTSRQDPVRKDSFATLAVRLPTVHTGGVNNFRRGVYSFESDCASNSAYGLSYVAWYNDVSQTIAPIHSGHRLEVVYDLVSSQKENLSAAGVTSSHFELRRILRNWSNVIRKDPMQTGLQFMFCLDKYYAPHNLSLARLSGSDLRKAKKLSKAALESGCTVALGDLDRMEEGQVDITWDYNGREELSDFHAIDWPEDFSSSLTRLVDLEGNELATNMPFEEIDKRSNIDFDELECDEELDRGDSWTRATHRWKATVLIIVPDRLLYGFLNSESSLDLDELEKSSKELGPESLASPRYIRRARELESFCEYQVLSRTQRSQPLEEDEFLMLVHYSVSLSNGTLLRNSIDFVQLNSQDNLHAILRRTGSSLQCSSSQILWVLEMFQSSLRSKMIIRQQLMALFAFCEGLTMNPLSHLRVEGQDWIKRRVFSGALRPRSILEGLSIAAGMYIAKLLGDIQYHDRIGDIFDFALANTTQLRPHVRFTTAFLATSLQVAHSEGQDTTKALVVERSTPILPKLCNIFNLKDFVPLEKVPKGNLPTFDKRWKADGRECASIITLLLQQLNQAKDPSFVVIIKQIGVFEGVSSRYHSAWMMEEVLYPVFTALFSSDSTFFQFLDPASQQSPKLRSSFRSMLKRYVNGFLGAEPTPLNSWTYERVECEKYAPDCAQCVIINDFLCDPTRQSCYASAPTSREQHIKTVIKSNKNISLVCSASQEPNQSIYRFQKLQHHQKSFHRDWLERERHCIKQIARFPKAQLVLLLESHYSSIIQLDWVRAGYRPSPAVAPNQSLTSVPTATPLPVATPRAPIAQHNMVATGTSSNVHTAAEPLQARSASQTNAISAQVHTAASQKPVAGFKRPAQLFRAANGTHSGLDIIDLADSDEEAPAAQRRRLA